ncbi:MAG: hypothetical protein LBP50_04255 [Tannerella sp.]|nr:hypothetical protein [Tannerella sp.]
MDYTSRGTVLCMARFDKNPGKTCSLTFPIRTESGVIPTCRNPEGRHAVPDGIFIGLSHAQNHAARSINNVSSTRAIICKAPVSTICGAGSGYGKEETLRQVR